MCGSIDEKEYENNVRRSQRGQLPDFRHAGNPRRKRIDNLTNPK